MGAGAGVMGVGAEASSNATRELLNRDGDLAACAEATSEDPSPPEGCGALLRVEVSPIAPAGANAEGAPPAEGTPAAATPRGLTAGKGQPKVHLETSMQFLQLFRLGVGVIPIHTPQGTVYQAQNEGVCTAPCDQVIDGTRGDQFGLYNDEAWVGPPFRLDQAPSRVSIQVEPDREASTFLRVTGFIGLITGSLGMAYGLVNVLFNGIQSTSDTSASGTEVFGPVEAGVVGLAGGATVLVGGILMMVISRPTFAVDYSKGVTVDASRSRTSTQPPGTLFTF